MIAVLQEASDPGHSEGARWAKMRIHRIASEIMTELGYSSKLNAEWDFLCMLRVAGRPRPFSQPIPPTWVSVRRSTSRLWAN